MLSLAPTVRVFVAGAPFNMHRSFDSLAGEVRRLLPDPLDGQLYVFLNARRTMMKAIFFAEHLAAVVDFPRKLIITRWLGA
jgi:hypothetical protein